MLRFTYYEHVFGDTNLQSCKSARALTGEAPLGVELPLDDESDDDGDGDEHSDGGDDGDVHRKVFVR